MAPLSPSSSISLGSALQSDPQLLSLPAPRRGERRITEALLLVTAVAALAMIAALSGEIAYALASPVPADLGNVIATTPSTVLANTYVRAAGTLQSQGVLHYERPMEGDSFRLAAVTGNPRLWVEVRVPQGMEGTSFVPPTSFVGRFVPFQQAGVRHAGLLATLRAAGGPRVVPDDAWLLVDGASPRASRWSLALTALFTYFALWGLVGFFRLRRPAPLR